MQLPSRSCCLIVVTFVFGNSAHAAVDYRDTLEKAFASPDESELATERAYDIFVADQWSYDSNIFRLPSSTNVVTQVGPNATRSDNFNTASLGFEGQWTSGRQRVNLDLRADDNRYIHNTNLDNVSSNDRITWDWGLGSKLSGEAGAYFYRSLASFVNSIVYVRDVIDTLGYYGTVRYQVGPHWAVFGGALGSQTTLSADASKPNNNDSKIVDFGTEFAMSPTNSVGIEYRFNDTTFPNEVSVNSSIVSNDYKEDTARLLLKYAFSDKTSLDANAGYLKREYTSSAFHGFGGDTWRVSLRWQPTDKTQISVDTWRKLQAYLTAQSQYFVANGVSVGPTIAATEKLGFNFLVSAEQQKYVGVGEAVAAGGPTGGVVPFVGQRHDRVDAGLAGVTYNPITSLTLNGTVRYEHRLSNDEPFQYNDVLANASFNWRF
jgi:hypothetical protein